ncbi:hypothetical protein CWB85_16420 [Pseudoalteromonas sp. S1727]|uniref:hypothetical protein n=1 Tax=Pseudoalteromonas sp. S1727 TaxID=2066514 RepID=UPI0011081C52|nr:hypothetical protein [Pseudoalteromonas sp. S1727]TMN70079.1 hypothetical protein CWB85_16420 [Pseudoalteromonas sp. S1727]
MFKKLISVSLLVSLVGCGGTSDDKQTSSTSVTVEETTSSVSFYIAPWQAQSGTLTLVNDNTGNIENIDVANINSVTLPAGTLNFHRVEFVSDGATLPCPSFAGCGRTFRDNPYDENSNRRIDYQEQMDMTLSYRADFLAAPGENKLYLSPVSSLISDDNLDITLQSVSATPFYHLTHSQLNDNLEAELLTNALTFGVILKRAADIELSLTTSSSAVVEQQAKLESLQLYRTYADRYVSENLLNVKGNQLLQSVVGEVKQKLASIGEAQNIKQRTLTEQQLHSKELLEDVRNILGVARLQEQKYSDELSQKLTEFVDIADNESQQTLIVLANVLYDVIYNFSPLNDTEAGIYTLQGLTINYQESPYSWVISGQYDNHEVQLDLNIPQWRISGLLGNQVSGVMNAKVIGTDTQLSVDVSDLVLSFDGTDDPFANDQSETTGQLTIATNVTLKNEISTLNGDISLAANRFVTPFEELVTVLSGFDFKGQLVSENQITPFSLQAIEATPFIDEASTNIVFAVQLELPLNGANDLQFAYVGSLARLTEITNANIALRLKNRALEINLRTVGNNINAVIKGAQGRWLDVKQKGRNYSGGLYFGDTQIADVTAVRGVPGILFPDGTFESLF